MKEAYPLRSLLPIGYLVLASLGCTKTDALGAGGNDDSGVDGIAPSGGSTGTGGTTVPALGGTPSTGGTTAGSGGSTATVGTTATPLGGTPSTCGMTGSSSLLDMLPPDNEVDTWVQTGGVSLITDQTGLYSRIDGGAPKYIDRGWVSSVYVNYSQGSRTIQVAIHDMGNDANAQAIYNYVLPPARQAIPGLANAVVDLGLATAYAAYASVGRFYIELDISEKSAAALTSIELFVNDILDRIGKGCPNAGSAPDAGIADAGTADAGADCASQPLTQEQATALYRDFVNDPVSVYSVEELQVPGAWEAMGIQLFSAGFVDPDGYVPYPRPFVTLSCKLYPLTQGSPTRLLSAVLVGSTLYYTVAAGSGINYTELGRISLSGGGLEVLQGADYGRPDPLNLYLRESGGQIVVELGDGMKFNSWTSQGVFGWLKDDGSTIVAVDSAGQIPPQGIGSW